MPSAKGAILPMDTNYSALRSSKASITIGYITPLTLLPPTKAKELEIHQLLRDNQYLLLLPAVCPLPAMWAQSETRNRLLDLRNHQSLGAL
jgi:hypothetical protein